MASFFSSLFTILTVYFAAVPSQRNQKVAGDHVQNQSQFLAGHAAGLAVRPSASSSPAHCSRYPDELKSNTSIATDDKTHDWSQNSDGERPRSSISQLTPRPGALDTRREFVSVAPVHWSREAQEYQIDSRWRISCNTAVACHTESR
ncbi:hypothetical protein QR685DRAFT_599193 [Neurospora intermedia]|uniref:Uncharacterized protein n=1 Tax=Neurospora intermedia TaxID=5142 RepID=A0ABR3D7E0_NEUIN